MRYLRRAALGRVLSLVGSALIGTVALDVSMVAMARAEAGVAASDAPGGDALSQVRQELEREQLLLQQEQAHILELEKRLAADEAAANAAATNATTAKSAAVPTAAPEGLLSSFGASGFTLASPDGSM